MDVMTMEKMDCKHDKALDMNIITMIVYENE